MKRLLSIELQKIWQNKASRILTIIYFLSLSLLATVALIEFDFGMFKFEAAKSGFFNFPYIWHFTTFIASWLKIFLAVIIVSMIANEYSYVTLKQNLIDGMSKKEFLLSKVYTILVFSLVSTILVFVISLILGLKYSSSFVRRLIVLPSSLAMVKSSSAYLAVSFGWYISHGESDDQSTFDRESISPPAALQSCVFHLSQCRHTFTACRLRSTILNPSISSGVVIILLSIFLQMPCICAV